MIKLKIKRTILSLNENGAKWTIFKLLRRLFLNIVNNLERRLSNIESSHNTPGLNNYSQNKLAWEYYNWMNLGEEWNVSKDWKQKFIETIINSKISNNSIITEIGPGGGRFTEFLIPKATKLNLFDISNKCLELCKYRFSLNSNVNYYLIENNSLEILEDLTQDVVFSYDVFVHLNFEDANKYFGEVHRVLKYGGVFIINFSVLGDKYGNFFSDLNYEKIISIISKNNFYVSFLFDEIELNEKSLNDLPNEKAIIILTKNKINNEY